MNIFRKSEENNNIIDERQIFEMYKVEHYRFWILFYGLLAVLLIETCVLEAPVQYVTPIWIVFMVGAIYSVIAYYRKGIWDDKCRNYVWSLHVHFMLTFYMLKRLLEQFQEPL